MNSSIRAENVSPKLSALLLLLTVTAVASAQHKNGPPPTPHASAPHASAPSRPAASQPHSAPAQHPGGSPHAAQRPGAPSGGNNRGPGGTNSNNRGPGGASANNRGQAGANNRGPGGANANNRGQAGANNRGPGGANNRGQAGEHNANNRGPGGGNRGPGGANRHQPAGSRQVALKNGGHATFRKDGKVREIRTAHGMRIEHGVHGGRHIESTHNGRQVVSMGRHGGYSQRAYYSHGGRTYVQRTYYVNGHYYAYGYRNYYYGGYPYYGYAPAYYYGPAYYGWAYNPWPAPVYYNWGWAGQPWYGYYGAYYQPYPVYPTAAFWLTDYLLAASLQAAFAAQQDQGDNGELIPPAIQNATADEIAALWSTDPLVAANLQATYGAYMLGGGAPAAAAKSAQLTPEVKQAISDEMKNEIAAEKAAANGQKDAAPSADQVPAALDPKIRIFVVSSDEDLTTEDGTECALTAGDVVSRTTDTPDDDKMVDAVVKSSKKDECAIGATVGISVDDLQEMHNQLRIQMDAGLKELAEKQGKNGLPAAPDTKTQPGEVPAPSADTNVGSDLEQQKKEADQAEAETQQSN